MYMDSDEIDSDIEVRLYSSIHHAYHEDYPETSALNSPREFSEILNKSQESINLKTADVEAIDKQSLVHLNSLFMESIDKEENSSSELNCLPNETLIVSTTELEGATNQEAFNHLSALFKEADEMESANLVKSASLRRSKRKSLSPTYHVDKPGTSGFSHPNGFSLKPLPIVSPRSREIVTIISDSDTDSESKAKCLNQSQKQTPLKIAALTKSNKFRSKELNSNPNLASDDSPYSFISIDSDSNDSNSTIDLLSLSSDSEDKPNECWSSSESEYTKSVHRVAHKEPPSNELKLCNIIGAFSSLSKVVLNKEHQKSFHGNTDDEEDDEEEEDNDDECIDDEREDGECEEELEDDKHSCSTSQSSLDEAKSGKLSKTKVINSPTKVKNSVLKRFLDKCKSTYSPIQDKLERVAANYNNVDSSSDDESDDGRSKSKVVNKSVNSKRKMETPSSQGVKRIRKVTIELLNSTPQSNRKFKRLRLDPGESPLLWSIDMEDLAANTSFIKDKSRYFKRMRCDHCHLWTDHSTKGCSKAPQTRPVCYICGLHGHMEYSCQEKICSKCQATGHDGNTCDLRFKELECSNCNIKGHQEEYCPNHWRQFHLISDTKEKSEQQSNSKAICVNKRKWCSFCAVEGHFGFECKRQERGTSCWPSSPFLKPSKQMFNRIHNDDLNQGGKFNLGKSPPVVGNKKRKSKKVSKPRLQISNDGASSSRVNKRKVFSPDLVKRKEKSTPQKKAKNRARKAREKIAKKHKQQVKHQ